MKKKEEQGNKNTNTPREKMSTVNSDQQGNTDLQSSIDLQNNIDLHSNIDQQTKRVSGTKQKKSIENTIYQNGPSVRSITENTETVGGTKLFIGDGAQEFTPYQSDLLFRDGNNLFTQEEISQNQSNRPKNAKQNKNNAANNTGTHPNQDLYGTQLINNNLNGTAGYPGNNNWANYPQQYSTGVPYPATSQYASQYANQYQNQYSNGFGDQYGNSFGADQVTGQYLNDQIINTDQNKYNLNPSEMDYLLQKSPEEIGYDDTNYNVRQESSENQYITRDGTNGQNLMNQGTILSNGQYYENKPAEKTGKQRIILEYIKNKTKRGVTFSKRKKGLMKKAYELNKLTNAEIMVVIANENGHVYTYTTKKFKRMMKMQEQLIRDCLNYDEDGEE